MTNSKSEIRNSKQIQMSQTTNSKQKPHYDLEERTFLFAKRVNEYVNKLPKTISNIENGRQLVKAAGSVGANYIEANESLSKKDFKMRIKISKKEDKESRYWLRLTEPSKEEIKEKEELIKESTELMKIFGSILEKAK
ncbi:MAG: four helix bundle protein [candidate division WOR-3 bacterium]|nr:four helix bundle protein [candidate division WOR-3 bacterium]